MDSENRKAYKQADTQSYQQNTDRSVMFVLLLQVCALTGSTEPAAILCGEGLLSTASRG